ncbi:hypothetical protein AKJ51_03810 [candidate division MSBL1 archaeon SCGC-AAA382A20]|uniref:4Fe-4S ferredoxin-type domain-containing protein n=1 Tax=candidate division MSBL1 archaeon SCGC-AAA382A20 TaxID=1698280 RepID=A0A133VIT9_9EURY|nr:hypothetical protein AKJ51_03810 [candidate division MSBL1 archaeon SCGC-AAA382A20]
MGRENFRYFLRIGAQITFLAVFASLIWSGLTQFWLVIFGAGVIGSVVFDRFYCGWVCPMGTLARPIGWIYEKFGIERLQTPELLRKGRWRWIGLVALALTMVYLRIAGNQLPVFLIVALIGVGFFLVWEEETFHKYICPYGVILSVTSRPSKFGMSVDKSKCTGCGACQEGCPNNAIATLDSDAREIESEGCLTCFRCEDACSVGAIEYRNTGDIE